MNRTSEQDGQERSSFMKIPDRILDDKINLEHECAFSLSLQSRRRAFVDFPIDINQAVPFSADIIASHYSRVD